MNEADINTNETNNMPLPARISEGVFCLVYLI